ncbi:MAG: cytosine permease [Actinomycetota bacterium]|jgi:NCS1 family nucleobase:cation symporter-1|nr:cytosine permease [Actinomycetota bacterium]
MSIEIGAELGASADVGVFGGATPNRHGDMNVEARGIQPIEDDRRYGSTWRMFTVWFAPNVEASALFLGAIGAVLGLGMVWGTVAVVTGTVLGSIPVASLCAWGPKTGAAQIPTARLPFGRTILLPSAVQWLSSIAWDGIVGIFGGEALQYLFNIPFAAGVAIVVVLEGVVAIWGHELIHVVEIAATVFVGALFIVLSVKILTHSGLTASAASVHGKAFAGAFILMLTLSFSDGISWASYASDYSRYLPRTTSERAVFWYTMAGLVGSYVWLEEVGLAAGHILTDQTAFGIDKLAGGGAVGALVLIGVALGAIASNAMNDYTGSLAMQTLNVKLKRPITAGVVMVLAYGLILWVHAGNIVGRFEDLLLFSSYWLSPFVAIVTIDWYHRRHNIRQEIQRITSWNGLSNEWGALLALLIGFGAAVPFMNATGIIEGPVAKALTGGDTAYYVGLIVAAIAYIPLRRWDVARERRRQAELPLATTQTVRLSEHGA